MRGQFFVDELDAESMEKLGDIIDMQYKMIELSRRHGRKKEVQCLGDVSDNPRFSKNLLLTKLYGRGRHANTTTVCSVHRGRGILKPVVRSQVTGVAPILQAAQLPRVAGLPRGALSNAAE